MTRKEERRIESYLKYPIQNTFARGKWVDLNEESRKIYLSGMEWADSHPVNQWHKVEDELPPRIKETVNVSKAVLVTNGLSYGTGYYNYNLNKWFCVGTTNIICWMELPELPKEE